MRKSELGHRYTYTTIKRIASGGRASKPVHFRLAQRDLSVRNCFTAGATVVPGFRIRVGKVRERDREREREKEKKSY